MGVREITFFFRPFRLFVAPTICPRYSLYTVQGSSKTPADEILKCDHLSVSSREVFLRTFTCSVTVSYHFFLICNFYKDDVGKVQTPASIA